MPEPLDLEVRIDPNGGLGPQPQCIAGLEKPTCLEGRLQLDGDASRHRLPDLSWGLARAGKADLVRSQLRVQGDTHLKRRSDINRIDKARQVLHDSRHRVGLHRVAEFDGGGQGFPEQLHPLIEQGPIVGEKRRRADPLRQPPQRHAADQLAGR